MSLKLDASILYTKENNVSMDHGSRETVITVSVNHPFPLEVKRANISHILLPIFETLWLPPTHPYTVICLPGVHPRQRDNPSCIFNFVFLFWWSILDKAEEHKSALVVVL